jgi:hypothetical protein
VYGDSDTTATIQDNPAVSGIQHTLVEAVGASFIDSGVRSGDTFRTSYGQDAAGKEIFVEFTVDLVVSNEQLLLLSGPSSPIVVPERYEIWRTLNNSDKVDYLVENNAFANKRVRKIFPGTVVAAEGEVPSYFVAAAYAGLRSGVAPHQGLTNVALNGFRSVPAIREFSRLDLDTLANAGYFIVTQDVNTGVIYSRKQLTTDVSRVDFAEDSVVASDDAIAYSYASVLAGYIGKSNVTPDNISLISADLNAMTIFLQNKGYSRNLGPLVIGADISSIRPHAVFPDRLVIRMNVQRPAPLNNTELYLVYSFLNEE